MDKILVSVIIPTYKRPFTMISRAIYSVLNQSTQNIEIIVVDDSPNDYAQRDSIKREIINIGDNRIRYVAHEFNKGACAARNTGIKISNGEYIGFLDDDDEWLPNKLELQLDKFEDKDIGLVYCASYSITMKNNKELSTNIRRFQTSGYVYDQLIKRNFVGSTSFVLTKKKVLEKSGLFNEKLKSAQDYELWLRISKLYKIDFVDKPLVKYYKHEGERISTNVDNKIQGLEKINKFNLSYLEKNPKTNGIRKARLIPYYYYRDGYFKTLPKFWDAFITYPFNRTIIKTFVKMTVGKM